MTAFTSLHKAISVFTRTYKYLRLSRQTAADHGSLKVAWAKETLESIGVETRISGEVSASGPLILVGNHLSYLDIPCLMLASSKISFLAKSEIGSWPVIGDGARAMDTIFVKRNNGSKRASAKLAVTDGLKDGRTIVLFPSGTTSLNESKPWRHGAFEIAKNLNMQIQPFRIRYSPIRETAYIDRDFFPVHLFRLAQLGKVIATIEFHPPVFVDDVVASCEKWQTWTKAARV